MNLEYQITVHTARADRVFNLINPITSLELEVWQDGKDTVIDIFYTFGFFETEVDEILYLLEDNHYLFTLKDV